jgi:FkbM family methyltransferase
MLIPEGYRLERGYLWPATDKGAAAAVFSTRGDMQVAFDHCKKFDVAIQAGGNCGIWPAEMGQKFRIVYTFEPDPMNFRCLCANAPAENIFKFNAALGDRHEMVGLALRPDNVGAHQVDGPGDIPTLCIDDIALKTCDLIYLDIEGSEFMALNGAIHTIRRCRPIIAVEDKGMSQRYGIHVGDVGRWVCSEFNYEIVARPSRDVVLAPC